MASTIKLKNGSGAPLASALVQGEPAFDLTNKRLYTENASGTVIEVGTNPAAEITANGGIALPDNQKATFGASDDLQIYHDGSNSYISDEGAGQLILKGSANIFLRSATDENYLKTTVNGAVELYYDNAQKLATTATGIDVTGTVTADGLSNNGDLEFTGTSRTISAVANLDIDIDSDSNSAGAALTITGNGGSNAIFKAVETGDISFYEDTGTTAKFFWDASAESLGIGTTSPWETLSIPFNEKLSFGSSTYPFSISRSSSGQLVTTFEDAYVSSSARIDFKMANGAVTPLSLLGSGNVGIGTTSPFYKLVVSAGGASGIEFGPAYSGTANLVQHYSRSGGVHVDVVNDAAQHRFRIGGSEAMRIDSSGNLLVGKTSAAYGTAGSILYPTGDAAFTRSGQTVGYFNRLTSDGEIVNLSKDGTTVGSIGADGGDLFIGTGDTGIRFSDSGNAIVGQNPSTVADSDDFVDLGTSGIRFKDLYLSGGVYLGGTGAANHLDDYEEGTWTPTIVGTTSGSATVSSITSATYTKIGRTVHVAAFIGVDTSTHTVVGVVEVGGLPFNPSSDAGTGTSSYSTVFTDNTIINLRPLSGNKLRMMKGSTSTSYTNADFTSAASRVLIFSAVYETTA